MIMKRCIFRSLQAQLIFGLHILEFYVVAPLPHRKLQPISDHRHQHVSGEVAISVSLVDQTKTSLIEISLTTSQDLTKLQKLTESSNRKIEVKVFQKSTLYPILTLELNKTPTILTKGFVKKYFSPETGEPIRLAVGDEDVVMANCFYTGHVSGMNDTYVSVSVCRGVNGVIETLDEEYQISSEFLNEKVVHHLVEFHIVGSKETLKCGTEDSPHHILPTNKFKRSVRLPAGSTMKTRYIEVYAVADYSVFQREGSVDAAMMRVINILNYASGLYRQLNIYLALVGIEVWNTGDQIPYKIASNGTELDSGMLLTEFNKYRQYNINFQTPNDNGQLFSAQRFHGSLLGKGSTRGICTQSDSGGVTYDGNRRTYVQAATTMAHELGHNLGLAHSNSDEYFGKNCECPADDDPTFTDCIMHSSANPYKQPKKWSQCTKDALEKYFTEFNLDQCLKNVPEKLIRMGNTPICGNFFVEEGEECDCGHPADCQSSCCDPTTCRLMPNATCATGTCCDLDTCTLRPYSYPCRPIQDVECDLVETCSGQSEWCPDDTYKQDGTECSNQGDAYCYNGKCRSHSSQCLKIWGGQNARRSDDICYTAYNNFSNYYGNCGWDSGTEDYGNVSVHKIFKKCRTEEDKFCGLLHCTKDSPRDLEPMIRNFVLVMFVQSYNRKYCISSSFDVGYRAYDPGQVPNGAKCAENKMCVNSRCVDVPTISDECYCNGRGVCNQFGECHCNIGWAPPFCDVKGMGGSVTSNPPVVPGPNLTLLVGLVTFFCGVVPIIAFLVIVIYCRRQELKRYVGRITSRYEKAAVNTPRKKSPLQAVHKRPRPTTKPNPPPAIKKASAPKSSKPARTDSISVDKSDSSNNRKVMISQPVLQSTTNKSPVLSNSAKMKPITPTRDAPKPPPHANSTDPTYENIKPRTPAKPKPAAPPKTKPITPPKTKPLAPPKSNPIISSKSNPSVPPKPNGEVPHTIKPIGASKSDGKPQKLVIPAKFQQ